MASEDSSYRQCQSLLKGLELLALLNQYPNATASISDLSRQTGQHRTTVKRLLETLRLAGYVAHDVTSNLYRVTFLVQRLSYGYRDTTLMSELAWPLMRSFSKKVVWPCSLVAPEGCTMVVRYSTRAYSPLSFHPGMPGRRMPMLSTAAGRAYFAFASEATQATLVEMIRSEEAEEQAVAQRARDDDSEASSQSRASVTSHVHMSTQLPSATPPSPHWGLASSDSALAKLVQQTRDKGYGMNLGEWEAEPKFSAFAAPIVHNGEVIICLNVVFLTSALNSQSKQDVLAQELLATAKSIEDLYAEEMRQWRPQNPLLPQDSRFHRVST